MRFNVGDNVVVKEDANLIQAEYIGFVPEMEKYLGQTHNISKVRRDGFYELEGCMSTSGRAWAWSEKWLEEAVDYNLNENDLNDLFK